MVDEVRPGYYAAGTERRTFEVLGGGFGLIPNDCLGIMSYDNSDPLFLKDTDIAAYICTVEEKTDGRIFFTADGIHQYSLQGYLGCIVSNDRQVVYWVNDSKPMP